MVEATGREPGCRADAFTPDPHDDALIRMWELWDDEASLAGNFESEHMAEWQARARDVAVSGLDIKKYTIADVSPLG